MTHNVSVRRRRDPLSRHVVLAEIQHRFGREPFTTSELAGALGLPEYRVRGAVSWLTLGQALRQEPETETRQDRDGGRYRVRRYRWTGVARAPSRVAHDPQERARVIADELQADRQAAINRWLRTKW